MILNKPNFWDTKNSFFSIILYPLSFLFNFVIFFKEKFTKQKNFQIPIICIGNIYLGGTGKTPTSIYIATELAKKNKKVAILKKYYKNHKDEHNLIKQNYDDLILSINRIDGINEAIDKGFETIVLDDGFQDYQIKKDLNIICFNQNQKVGNGLTFPAGPLREKIISLKRASIVIINGTKDQKFEEKVFDANPNIKIFYSKYNPKNIDHFKNKKILAFAGIGNPQNFFKILKENNLDVFKEMIYPDHYEFKKDLLLKLIHFANTNNLIIVTTEKDFSRIKHYNLKEINYLKVDLEIKDKESLLKEVFKIYD